MFLKIQSQKGNAVYKNDSNQSDLIYRWSFIHVYLKYMCNRRVNWNAYPSPPFLSIPPPPLLFLLEVGNSKVNIWENDSLIVLSGRTFNNAFDLGSQKPFSKMLHK